MWNLIKKDYLLILANKMEVYFFMMAVPVVIALGSLDEKMTYIIIISLVFLLTIIGFNNSNQDTDILTYSLPVKYYTVIISKYIMLFLNHIIITSYIFGITWMLLKLNLISGIHYMSFDFFKLTLTFSIIALSFILPLAFSLRSRSSIRGVMSVSFVILINYPNYLFYEGDLYNPAIDRVGLVNSLRFIMGVLILMIISIIVSLYGYKKKEF